MRDGKWEYTIRAYAPTNQGGGLLIETVHVGTSSRDMEIAVFRARMKRDEVSYIEVITHIEPFGIERIYERSKWLESPPMKPVCVSCQQFLSCKEERCKLTIAERSSGSLTDEE